MDCKSLNSRNISRKILQRKYHVGREEQLCVSSRLRAGRTKSGVVCATLLRGGQWGEGHIFAAVQNITLGDKLLIT